MTNNRNLGPRQAKVLAALREIGGKGRLRDIVASYIKCECSSDEQVELDGDEEAWGRIYDNTANALKNLRQGGHVVNEGGVWRLAAVVVPPKPPRAAPTAVDGDAEGPRGWRQRRVLHAMLALGGKGTLLEIVASYVAELSEAERADFELNPIGWEREYASIASALTHLKDAAYVSRVDGIWSVAEGHSVTGRRAKGVRERKTEAVCGQIDARTILADAIRGLGIDFAALIAATAVWAPTPQEAKAAKVARRARPGQGERRGMVVRERRPGTDDFEDVRLDDNTYANVALKRAIGNATTFVGFETCHIWPLSCYDVRYHTLVPNLVLLPRAIAGLTDHDEHVQECLRYRAFELFGWYPGRESEDPAKKPANPPARPDKYADNWR